MHQQGQVYEVAVIRQMTAARDVQNMYDSSLQLLV
jgi:hypothetical protein